MTLDAGVVISLLEELHWQLTRNSFEDLSFGYEPKDKMARLMSSSSVLLQVSFTEREVASGGLAGLAISWSLSSSIIRSRGGAKPHVLHSTQGFQNPFQSRF